MHKGKNSPVKKFLTDRKATSAVEFSIVAPIFILMIFGMCAYGIFFGTSHSVQQLAADAARASIPGLNLSERKMIAEDFIDKNLKSYMFLTREFMEVELEGSDADSNQFLISLEYDASKLPIWNLYPPLPLPSKTIKKTSTVRIGGI